jgi:hypothetical protein
MLHVREVLNNFTEDPMLLNMTKTIKDFPKVEKFISRNLKIVHHLLDTSVGEKGEERTGQDRRG